MATPTAYPYDITSAQGDNRTSVPGQACTDGISGIVDADTTEGLHNFYISYGSIHGYVAIAVCLFGVLSNSANIIVLTRKNMQSSTNTLLLWLAVSDLLTMLSYLPFAIHFYITEPQDPTRPPFASPEFPWICFLLFHASFSIVCHTVAIWLTIALAIFRYIYICKPTSGAFYCSQQRARFVVMVVIALTIVICIPNYAVNTYEYYNQTKNISNIDASSPLPDMVTSKTNNNSVRQVITTQLFYPSVRMGTQVEKILNLFNQWIQAILIKLVPCGMLTTLTLLLVHAMHKAYRKRLKLKSQGKKAESDKHGEHNRTTGMLLAVVVLFTLTELPQGILTLMNIFVDCFTTVVYYKLGDLLDIMALTNNSVNFVLYCTMSTQFRNTFGSIFCPNRPAKPEWLKLKMKTSKRSHRTSIEEKDRCQTQSQNQRRVSNGRAKGGNPEEEGQAGDSFQHNSRLLNNVSPLHQEAGLTNTNANVAEDAPEAVLVQDANGVSTHTHGFSPDHSHV